MGACTAAPRPSSHHVRPTSNSVPEQPGAKESLKSGWPAGSPDESNTKTQQPHDAFFMKRRALFTSLWKVWVATIWIQETKKLMSYEERRLMCRQTRCANNTLSQGLYWYVCPHQRISKRPAFRLRTTCCTDPAHDVDKTIVVCLSFAITYSALLARNSISRFSNALLVFLHNRRHSRNNTNIWHQAHSWCRLVNHQFPLRWTWHTLSDKGDQSNLQTCHSDSVQDVASGLGANNFTWWIYIFIHEIPVIFIQKSDQFVCQQWRQHAFSRILWGTIFKYSLNLETPFWDLFTSHLTSTALLTSYLP